MTAEERQMLADLFERVRAAGANARDPQAETVINDAVRALPFAPYVLAQTVLVQQHALEAAGQRIQELQAQAQNIAPQAETSFLGGIGKALFGAPATPAAGTPPPYRPAAPTPVAPQPSYAQSQPAPGPWGGPAASGGFLSGALRTAAGVAGGIAVADMLGGLLGGHGLFGGGYGAGYGGMFGGGAPIHETVNNFYGSPTASDPTQGVDNLPDPAAGGALPQDAGFDPGGADSGGFDDAGADGGFDDAGSGGGFDV